MVSRVTGDAGKEICEVGRYEVTCTHASRAAASDKEDTGLRESHIVDSP